MSSSISKRKKELHIYISVPSRICYDEDRYRVAKQEIEEFKKLLDCTGVNYRVIWYDSNSDEWDERWARTVKNAHIILYYLQPGDSDFLGRGSFDMHRDYPDTPQFIMYKPSTVLSASVRFYKMNRCEVYKDGSDWQRYAKVGFNQRIQLEAMLAKGVNYDISAKTHDPDEPVQIKTKTFVEALLAINIYK